MNNHKTTIGLLASGIVIGVILAVVIIYLLGAKPKTISIGPIEFEMPTETQNQKKEILLTTPKLSPLNIDSTSLPLSTNTFEPTKITQTPSLVPTKITQTPSLVPTTTPDPRLFWDDFEMGIKPEWGMFGQSYASTNGQLIVVEGMLETKIVGNTTWGDYEIRVNGFSLSGCCTTVKFFIRAQNNSNYMQLTCREDNADGYADCFWHKVINGKEQSIPGAGFGIMVGGDHILRIEMNGSNYTTFWDGEQKIRFADNTYSNGGISLRINPRGKIGIIEVLKLP